MALKVNHTQEETGLVITDAYVRIGKFSGDKDLTGFNYQVFVSEQTRLDGKGPIQVIQGLLPTPTTDLIPALYTHLKTLPEFTNAIDC